jgi:transposase
LIGSSRAVRVFARRRPTDLRKGFDGLYGLVRTEFGQDPLRGDLFLFVNRRRSSAKVLLWDGTGLCIYSKRLSKRRFTKLWANAESTVPITLTHSELSLFLEGADLSHRLPISPPEITI